MKTLTLSLLSAALLCAQSPANRAEVANKLNFCRGAHPRCAISPNEPYAYHQFGGSREIGEFFSVAEYLPPGPPIMHHQSFLAEIISERADTNAVAFWSDAKAIIDHGRVWGGFISARSEYRGSRAGGDAQLIGLEIDVLNDGKPGISPYQSKVGVQIVGFGRANTNAIEVLAEEKGGGKWHNGLNLQPGALTSEGAVFGIGPQKARVGLSMFGSEFSDAAMVVSANQRLSFRELGSPDASIYRDKIGGGYLVNAAGPAGFRITNAENTRNLFVLRPDGSIDKASAVWQFYWPWIAGGGVVFCGLLALTAFLAYRVSRLERLLQSDGREAALVPQRA